MDGGVGGSWKEVEYIQQLPKSDSQSINLK